MPECQPSVQSGPELAEAASEYGAVGYLSKSDNPDDIEALVEVLLEDARGEAAGAGLVAVACGGGGLISGCALAAAKLSPGCRVVGVEPEAGDDANRSFRTSTLQRCHNPDTIADGARTSSAGAITFLGATSSVSEGAGSATGRIGLDDLELCSE